MYDLIVIGGGPAGLTAALYARRANKSVLVIEKAVFGGQITYSPKVENIPGFVSLTGNEFAEKLVEQVLEQGAEVDAAEVLAVREADGVFTFSVTGYGHGVGMSQYGANAMAAEGSTWQEIVTHYYTGIDIESVTST